ncbi:MAG: glycosyltransferase [Firmicutes bacterium]|nr:glycosyltransferase [Bacillota bacterium]
MVKMQPLLSVVIATYNNETTIKKAIDSILIQKIDNWELLLVDDGGTDSCPQIVDDYAKADSRIKVFHKTNGGCNSAFNVGLEQATGKYVTFCGADDTYEPDAFEIISQQAEEYEYDIIYMLVNYFDCDSNQKILELRLQDTLPSFAKQMDTICIKEQRQVQHFWIEFLMSGINHNTINVYKSSIIKKYKYREDVYGSDYLLNIELADDIKSISCSSQPIYNHFYYISLNDDMKNISVGKYYDYTRDMYNEYYIKYKQLFLKWDCLDETTLFRLSEYHIICWLEYLISQIFAYNNKNTTAQNIDIITSYYDDVIFETANFSNNLVYVDNKFSTTILAIMQNTSLPANFDNPIVRMFTALNNTTISFDEIKSEITHSLLDYRNPYRIGFETYKTLSAKHTQIANADLIAYLETERTARQLLFTGNFEQALNKVIELFNSQFSTPEQYVTLALCGYNLGLLEDAKNAVETGLANFPNYGRLENLLDIINAERAD